MKDKSKEIKQCSLGTPVRDETVRDDVPVCVCVCVDPQRERARRERLQRGRGEPCSRAPLIGASLSCRSVNDILQAAALIPAVGSKH